MSSISADGCSQSADPMRLKAKCPGCKSTGTAAEWKAAHSLDASGTYYNQLVLTATKLGPTTTFW